MSLGILSLASGAALATAVAGRLALAPLPVEERGFEDGEHKIRPLAEVRGLDLYLVQPLFGGPDLSADEKLVRSLFLAAALVDQGAARVTLVAPYLAYARKDRRTKPRDPITTRYLAQLFEAVGTDVVVTLEPHNLAAFENAFRCRAVPLDTRRLFAPALKALVGEGAVVVASPDPGGIKRAQLFRESFERALGRPVGAAFLEKRRSGGVVSGDLLVGEVAGASVILVDDLIATGGTLRRAAETCLAHGAARVVAAAAHGLFTAEAAAALATPALARVLVTDTVTPLRLSPAVAHVEVVSAVPLFAEAIRRLHGAGSITALLEG